MKLLSEERKKNNEEEQVYEFRKALNHANMFCKLNVKDSKELVNKLIDNEKIKPSIAIKITDILPATNDELRSIFSKEKYTLKKEELQNLLDIIKQYT